jgi:ABC-type antimicrobial peptide transport system permease subunit
MPVSEVRSMDDILAGSVAQSRFALVLLASFAALALVLAVVGTYGVLAHLVGRRTREIGVRMALGAEPGRVVAMIVRQGLLTALVGIAVGVVAAWSLSGVMTSLLYGVTPQDPITFLTVPALLAGVAVLASWVPALRATRVRPSAALRYE